MIIKKQGLTAVSPQGVRLVSASWRAQTGAIQKNFLFFPFQRKKCVFTPLKMTCKTSEPQSRAWPIQKEADPPWILTDGNRWFYTGTFSSAPLLDGSFIVFVRLGRVDVACKY